MKILYFTAGDKPTSGEQAAIDALKAGQYDLGVRSAAQAAVYGPRIEASDYVAGSPPSNYDAVPEWAGTPLPDGTASVANGATVQVRRSTAADAHPATAVVTGNTLTGVNLAATATMVDQGDTMVLQNSAGAAKGNVTATVAAGVVSNVRPPATVAIVQNGDAVTIGGTTYTFTVAAGVISAIATAP